ncbi:DUF3231 family protein [Paenibacillus sp. F411]|uniref:DUF3231 family protein n=1 Tax=Paenibacillus sp. F411 TaxID=2820239 RepID=UPI001AAFD1E3|nr:DUF3231 family protein [Paenibacillus sp. F411]MBO2945670.1 DUF3231 family protein [Paenibacillus sp. F411]
MGILDGNPKDEPMHYGEVYGVWMASMGAKGMISCYQAYMNHAGDKELKHLLSEMLEMARLESKELDELLTEQGIVPPPALPERPEVHWEDIPAGARFSDPETAAKLAVDCAAGLAACSMAMGQSIREDIAALFAKYHTKKAALGLKVLRMNKEKGWLIPPPLHIQRSE